MDWYIWINKFGSVDIDTTEHGHYDSVLYKHCTSWNDAEKTVNSREFSDWMDENYPEKTA